MKGRAAVLTGEVAAKIQRRVPRERRAEVALHHDGHVVRGRHLLRQVRPRHEVAEHHALRDDDGDDEAFDEPLTAREVQVLELLAEGLPNKRIAGRLGISDQTVKFHVSAISGKLGAANRTDAVRRAVRRGLITF